MSDSTPTDRAGQVAPQKLICPVCGDKAFQPHWDARVECCNMQCLLAARPATWSRLASLRAALDAAEAEKKNLNLIIDDISDLANAIYDVGYWDATKGESSSEYREASDRASWLWDGMEQRAGRPVWKARPGNGEDRPVETEGMLAFTTAEVWAQLEEARVENARLREALAEYADPQNWVGDFGEIYYAYERRMTPQAVAPQAGYIAARATLGGDEG